MIMMKMLHASNSVRLDAVVAPQIELDRVSDWAMLTCGATASPNIFAIITVILDIFESAA